MFPRHMGDLSFLFALFLFLMVACGDQSNNQLQPTEPAVAPPDPMLATPQAVLAEGPLGSIPDIPTILIVSSRQSKAALAAFIKTTPEQLDWVNPGLPDPIVPGTLIVIPPIYRSPGETLAAVAQKTGLPEEVLRAANPRLGNEEIVAAGKVLAMPALYIVPADTLLSSTAQTLETSNEALLSANPALANRDEIRAGTVLIVPPESDHQ